MCGICGVITRAPIGVADQASVDRMNAALVHRGPDSAGNFTHGHTLAIDSKGNVYVAETDWGRRIQKFRPVGDR